MRSFFVRRVLFPAMELVQRRDFRSVLEEYRRLQFLPAPELKARQEAGLRSLVRHVFDHVPFYRDRFEERRLVPGDVRGIDDLALLPVTGKEEIRRAFPRKITSTGVSPSRRILDRTSGSSGIPLEFYRDKSARDRTLASFLLFNEWVGIEPGERTVHIGAPQPRPFGSRFAAALRGHRDLAAFDLRADNTDRLLRELSRLSPALIEGYASAIFHLAQAAMMREAAIRPKAVVTTSDTLPAAEPIRRAFGCPVFVRYGNREICGALAQSCPAGHEGLHVNTDLCILEVVDEAGRPVPPGRRGRVVLTDLTNRVMPLLRLDTGDTASLGGPCPCGRGFPLVGRLEGRSSEFLASPDGRLISPVALGHFLFVTRPYISHILRFQAEQTGPDQTIFRFVPLAEGSEGLRRALLRDLGEFLGRGMKVGVEFVEDIPAGPAGKRAVVVRSTPSVPPDGF